MSNNHSLSRNITYKGKTSKIYFAKKPTGDLIIFIHGFGGDPVKTWSDFPGILTTMPEFAGMDILFYGYDSLFVQAFNSAIVFNVFMERLLKQPNELIAGSRGNKIDPVNNRPEGFKYQKIYLVAHSLGAIVSRLALNQCHKNKGTWHKLTKMILFAPAHLGARVGALSNIPKLMLPSNLQFIPAFLLFKVVTVDDVDLSLPHCILHSLKEETVDYQQQGVGGFTISNRVLLAQNETIVHNGDFLKDPPAMQIDNRNHVNICKPDESYKKPVIELLKSLDHE